MLQLHLVVSRTDPILRMINPVRHSGVCLLPQSCFVLQYYQVYGLLETFWHKIKVFLVPFKVSRSLCHICTTRHLADRTKDLCPAEVAGAREYVALGVCQWVPCCFFFLMFIQAHQIKIVFNTAFSLAFLILLSLVENTEEKIYEPRSQMFYTWIRYYFFFS